MNLLLSTQLFSGKLISELANFDRSCRIFLFNAAEDDSTSKFSRGKGIDMKLSAPSFWPQWLVWPNNLNIFDRQKFVDSSLKCPVNMGHPNSHPKQVAV